MEQGHGDLHHDDLVWARALAAGDRVALERYERELAPIIAGQLGKRGHTQDQIADLQQTIRARLFVGDGDGPAIAGYTGSGKLKSWVLVAALREAVRMRKRDRREPNVTDEALIALADRSDAVPEHVDKERYREAFRVAFKISLGLLTPRDRNLLRMNLIDELSIDQISALLGVHRSTAARWIATARDAVALGVRKELQRILGTDPFEAESVMRWVQSRIELSLSGLARTETNPAT